MPHSRQTPAAHAIQHHPARSGMTTRAALSTIGLRHTHTTNYTHTHTHTTQVSTDMPLSSLECFNYLFLFYCYPRSPALFDHCLLARVISSDTDKWWYNGRADLLLPRTRPPELVSSPTRPLSAAPAPPSLAPPPTCRDFPAPTEGLPLERCGGRTLLSSPQRPFPAPPHDPARACWTAC